MPGTGFDQRGVWVGKWIPDREPPAVPFTPASTGHSAGIGLAEVQADGALESCACGGGGHAARLPGHARSVGGADGPTGWLMLIRRRARGSRMSPLVYSYTSEDGTHWEPAGEFGHGRRADCRASTGASHAPAEWATAGMLMGTPVVANTPAKNALLAGRIRRHGFHPRRPGAAAARHPRHLSRPDGWPAAPKAISFAIGIVADEIRDEQARHEAGWVPRPDPGNPCWSLARTRRQNILPVLRASLCRKLRPDDFRGRHARQWWNGDFPPTRAGTPRSLRATIEAADGGTVRIGTRLPDEGPLGSRGDESTRKRGRVRLDYTQGGRSSRSVGPRSSKAASLRRNASRSSCFSTGAAVFGTLNGRPLGLYSPSPACRISKTGLRLSVDGDADIEHIPSCPRAIWGTVRRSVEEDPPFRKCSVHDHHPGKKPCAGHRRTPKTLKRT